MKTRAAVSVVIALIGCVGALQACSADDRPPAPLDPSGGDSGLQFDSGVAPDPCNPPQDGCPCADAGVGTQVGCGVIYRTSGTHVDCSQGYRTCQEDGGWGACEGTHVYIAADQ